MINLIERNEDTMRQTYRQETIEKRCRTTKKLLSTVVAVCLLFGTAISALAQANFEGSLKSVSISDSAGTNSPPTATFAYTQDGVSFSFDASSSSDSDGNIIEYKWDFGDGTAGSNALATHMYNSEGIYPVTLTTVDNNNAVTLAQLEVNTTQEKYLFQWDMETTTSALNKSGESITMSSAGGADINSQGFEGNAVNLNGGYHAYYSPQAMSPDQLISHTAGKITIYGKRLNISDPITLFYFSDSEIYNALVLQHASTTLVEVTFGGKKVYNYQSGGSLKLAKDLNWHKFELSWDNTGSIKLIVDDTYVREHNFGIGLQNPFTKLAFGTLSNSGFGLLDNVTIE